MEIINAGLNGDHISFMRARLYDDVLSFKPDAVIILWDSDIADQSEDIIEDNATQLQYKEDLYFILQHLKANNCSHISVSEDSSHSGTSSQPQRPYSFVLKMDTAVVTSVTTTADSESKKHFRVVLFGDSLMNVPCGKFGLQMQLTSQFPEYDLEVINAGINSDRIAYMRARLDKDVLSWKPDAVMLFWDSDISDQSIEVLDLTETKLRYEEDLRAVLTSLKANCSYLSALACWERALSSCLVVSKARIDLDNILYIDLRQAFQDGLPFGWLFSRWYLTSDGEHPNERGTQIMAKKFGEVIATWLTN
eukprot:gene31165-40522_t